MNYAVGAIFKNEDAYLLEWLAFHRVIGFSRFMIADNGSSDLTRQMLAALEPHEPLTVLDFPDVEGKRPQLSAYNALISACPKDVDAIAFVDIDEFIVPMDGADSVTPALDEVFGDPEVSSLALNWACFGSSGKKFWEDGLVMERFIKRGLKTFPVNQHYKSVVRPDRVAYWDTPHHAQLTSGRLVDTSLRDVQFRANTKHSLSHEVLWDKLRINHYVVKSVEEFVLKKSPKGSASKAGRVKHQRYFELHDKNARPCEEILRFVPAVKAEILRLEAIIAPAIRDGAPNEGSGFKQWFRSIRSGLRRE